MIVVRLSIDPAQEPVSGQILGLTDTEPTPFIGYVALISALERLRDIAQGDDREGQER